MRIYKKNFLTRVLIKIDFPAPIPNLKNSLVDDLMKKALELFPIKEPRQRIGMKLEISPKEVKREDIEAATEWVFHGRNREKSLNISPDFMYVSYKKFESFDKFKSDFFGISDILFKSYRGLQVSRLGLRYVNNIELQEPNPIDWSNYLNDNLLSFINLADDRNTISRAFHTLDLNLGNMKIRFRYGMHNPDYPAPIRKKLFILDYDAFLEGLQNEADMISNIDKFNNEIESMFEKCIKDGLREIMDRDG